MEYFNSECNFLKIFFVIFQKNPYHVFLIAISSIDFTINDSDHYKSLLHWWYQFNIIIIELKFWENIKNWKYDNISKLKQKKNVCVLIDVLIFFLSLAYQKKKKKR